MKYLNDYGLFMENRVCHKVIVKSSFNVTPWEREFEC